jgi:queuosine precursor transporter
MPRIILASIFAYLISQYTDTFIYGFLKNRLNNKFFILKNYGSILISQLIDTAIFSFLGLYSLVNNIWDIFIVSFFIKAISIIIIVPLASSFIKKIK